MDQEMWAKEKGEEEEEPQDSFWERIFALVLSVVGRGYTPPFASSPIPRVSSSFRTNKTDLCAGPLEEEVAIWLVHVPI